MKRLKRILLVAGAGFLAFAPPGTMIFIFLLLLGVIGNVRIVASLGCLVVVGLGWVAYRKRLLKRSSAEKPAPKV